ncbi:unnamed protein product [Spirodela intermedia]|uniref:Uncharacterized protein n=2 Tax=Spirodela intermedia TaxID=51605 RepID=A0A7I8KQR4_SPIIN|nr:unnamed protein product [Spirodela intermedia]CAA6663201.1 unnamed protein product [Spirodela intermedia]CAA7399646.1 unnamed protein product [Spirodela intermedia]
MERRKRNGPPCVSRPRQRRRFSTVSLLLLRLREVVFRLIAPPQAIPNPTAPRQAERPPEGHHRTDPCRSEGVEDCIEFFKRSSAGEETGGEAAVAAAAPPQPCRL